MGLSQQAVADLVGITKTTYYKWETNQTDIKASFLPKLAEVFGVDISALFPPDLTVTVNHPNGKSLTFDAREVYEDLIGYQRQKIQGLEEQVQTLETENQRLQEQAQTLEAEIQRLRAS